MEPRKTAWSILCRVIQEGGYANLLLRKLPEDSTREDRALVSEIVYGTLRNQTMLELQWKDLVRTSVRPKTAILLDLSVYQLQYMSRIPAYAVINEAVRLAEKRDKGFVNAVLRAVSKRDPIQPQGEELECLAIRTSHPLFLLKLWAKQYGMETAAAIAQHDQLPSRVYGRLNTLRANKDDLNGVQFLEGDCFVCDGDLIHSSWFKEGKALIQDRASQKIVPLLDPKPGMRVLDVCSAPGTKAQQMACLMNNEGRIDAYDCYPERVKLIDALMERTGVSIVHSGVRDGTVPLEERSESYDRILIDAPCSGLGDLSHKPEIRFHVTPESLDELAALQKQLLDVNAPYLKKGGQMVYSTCTLNKKENESQIKAFLTRHEEFELAEEHTVFPMEADSDGFYMALLKKRL